MNERIKELAKQVCDLIVDTRGRETFTFDNYGLESFAALVEAQERDFIATKWETWYGYDKQGVAEFIRKRANTQGERHE